MYMSRLVFLCRLAERKMHRQSGIRTSSKYLPQLTRDSQCSKSYCGLNIRIKKSFMKSFAVMPKTAIKVGRCDDHFVTVRAFRLRRCKDV